MNQRDEVTVAGKPLWRRALLWLLFLGPFFFLVYGLCNWWTAQRTDIRSFYYAWETFLPYVPELMLPYMSIDIFFAVSFFVCRTKQQLDRHSLRILLAIMLSAAGFLLFPLQFSFDRPQTDGFNGFLLEILLGFDKPYNQAPSLHISLLMLLWYVYHRVLRGKWRYLLHIWFALIGLSVVLVYQHHVIDVITAVWAGAVCFYLLPDEPRWEIRKAMSQDTGRYRIGHRYLTAAILLLSLAIVLGGWFWLLIWPSLALCLVALGYYKLDHAVFHKQHGRHSQATRWLLLPYFLGAQVACRWYTYRYNNSARIAENVFIGHFSQNHTNQRWHAVLDMTAEFERLENIYCECYQNLPVLDLTVPHPELLWQAATFIERQQQNGKVLVYCAWGLSRSASAIIVWLLSTGKAATVAEAEELIGRCWRTVVLTPAHRIIINEAVACGKN